jgi:hypothetical protein
MKTVLPFVLPLLLSACAAVPGSEPTLNRLEASTACIHSTDTSYQTNLTNLGFEVQGIESALYQSGLKRLSDKSPRKKYHLLIEGSVSQPIFALSYAEFFAAMATAFVIPAYSYKNYSLTITVLENEKAVNEVTVKDSAHEVVSLFAGFAKADSSASASTVEKEIGRRLAKKALSSIICG